MQNHIRRKIAKSSVDPMLMPYAYCVPSGTNAMATEKDLERLHPLPFKVVTPINFFWKFRL